MQTECSADLFGFVPVEGRAVVAAFDGGAMTSEAGAMLLGATDRQIGVIERFAGCFTDHRAADLVEHTVASLVAQRVFGIALGHEDLIDHDQLRHDPVMAVLGGKLKARRADCAPLAGKSTLNRLELSRLEPTRYHKISYDAAAIEGLFVDLFLDAHSAPPPQITLDLDATDDPVHGQQEERFFHGYYDTYCYLPLYVFCGRHLLAAKLRPANIDASAGSIEEVARIVTQIRQRWPTSAHSAACRFGLCPRGADGVVRDQRRRFPVWLGQEHSPHRRDRGGTGGGARAEPKDRKTGAPFQGFHLADAQELEPGATDRRQGGMDGRCGQPAFCRHVTGAGGA